MGSSQVCACRPKFTRARSQRVVPYTEIPTRREMVSFYLLQLLPMELGLRSCLLHTHQMLKTSEISNMALEYLSVNLRYTNHYRKGLCGLMALL